MSFVLYIYIRGMVTALIHKMRIVCSVYCGQLGGVEHITLKDLATYAHVHYQHKPVMVKFRSRNVTLLIFTNFKFRLMGGGDAHMETLQDFLQPLPWNFVVTRISLTNTTAVHQLPYHINLHKLRNNDRFSVDMELFPAAKFRHNGREHVNVFHTGQVVITGVGCINKVKNKLLPDLQSHLRHAVYH
jgi:TATA-box binding protein (TBP) (component of TFIID and TFIIIB)